ncbi:MFS transporter [Rhodococcus oxybenzonivorans]|uniref:MFS transporter n=1 Tax=Rhodococcus oxybenzonivorans TaxID=1990687 RepID=UPI0029544F23|nr:MFS transporter [Rhodococcus oxybenzonivorans]MDV7352823.1 MFS transporter [Rhodococcus oxybenzonivorans]
MGFDRRQFYNGVIQTGFPIGGCVVAIAAIFMIPAFGWKSMFGVGGLLGVVLFVIAYRNLPRTECLPRKQGSARRGPRTGAALFHRCLAGTRYGT